MLLKICSSWPQGIYAFLSAQLALSLRQLRARGGHGIAKILSMLAALPGAPFVQGSARSLRQPDQGELRVLDVALELISQDLHCLLPSASWEQLFAMDARCI